MNKPQLIDQIKTCSDIAQRLTPDYLEKITEIQESFNKPDLKVVVLGEFKAGKSTLINKVILKQDLLPTAFSESTAVPTYLSNGLPRLNIWERKNGTIVLSESMESFSEETLKSCITDSDEDERALKAQNIRKAEISFPGILPDNVILVDTPGINSTNTLITIGTIQEAIDADAIIYVIRAKTLNQSDLDFIKDLINAKNARTLNIPLHFVISHDGLQAKATLKNIADQIIAQVKNLGYSSDLSYSLFPIKEIEEETKGSASIWNSTILTTTPPSIFDTLFNTVPPPVTQADESNEASYDEINRELMDFIFKANQLGRVTKIHRDLLKFIPDISTQIQAALISSGKSAEEKAQIEKNLRHAQQEYSQTISDLLDDVRSLQAEISAQVINDINSIKKDYSEKINNVSSITELQSIIEQLKTSAPSEIQHTITQAVKKYKEQDIKNLEEKYQTRLRTVFTETFKDIPDLHIDAGILGKLPEILVIILDYLLTIILSPLPTIIDIPLRMFLNRFKSINKFLPINMVLDLAIKHTVKGINESFEEIVIEIKTTMDNTFADLVNRLHQSLSENGEQFSTLIDQIKQCENTILSADEIEDRENALKTLSYIAQS